MRSCGGKTVQTGEKAPLPGSLLRDTDQAKGFRCTLRSL
jgi:hypothetical protein